LGNNPTSHRKLQRKGENGKETAQARGENLQSCLQAVSSLFPMPLSLFVNSDFNLSESRSKDLKMSHKFRFWMAHLCAEKFFGSAGTLTYKTACYSLFAIFYRFGSNSTFQAIPNASKISAIQEHYLPRNYSPPTICYRLGFGSSQAFLFSI
jgi:hypothetical protein